MAKCPQMVAAMLASGQSRQAVLGDERADCLGGQCQHWTRAYTTERMAMEDCAAVIQAWPKDTTGRLIV